MSIYTDDVAQALQRRQAEAVHQIQRLRIQTVDVAQRLRRRSERIALLLNYGVGRRLMTIERGLITIFRQFAVDRETPLSWEQATDVQIQIQSYFINAHGLLRNVATIFWVLSGAPAPDDPIGAGIEEVVPTELRDFMSTPDAIEWLRKACEFDRSLTHGFPAFVQRTSYTHDQFSAERRHDEAQIAALRAHDWGMLEQITAQREQIGTPLPVFSLSESAESDNETYWIHHNALSAADAVVQVLEVTFRNLDTQAE